MAFGDGCICRSMFYGTLFHAAKRWQPLGGEEGAGSPGRDMSEATAGRALVTSSGRTGVLVL